MTQTRRLAITAGAASLSLFIAAFGWAQPGPGPGGPGMHGRHRGGERPPMMRKGPRFPAAALMHVRPEILKEKLGLNDTQVAHIVTLRTDFQNKQTKLREEIKKNQDELQQLMQAEMPNQGKVLAVVRKMGTARNQLAEERVKTQLKLLAELKPAQRTKLKTEFANPSAWGGGHGPGACPCKGAPNCPCAGPGQPPAPPAKPGQPGKPAQPAKPAKPAK